MLRTIFFFFVVELAVSFSVPSLLPVDIEWISLSEGKCEQPQIAADQEIDFLLYFRINVCEVQFSY